MRAKITKPDGYLCCPEGHTAVRYMAGTIVTGQVAEWAVADKAASRMFNPVEETKVTPALETKGPRRKRKAVK